MVKRAQRTRSMGRFYGALALIAIVGLGAIAWVMSRPKAGVRVVDPSLPPAKAQGQLIGNPNAPVQVLEFADFECPSCGQFATITEPDVRKRLVETGLVSYRYYDFPLPMHKNTIAASSAAACAADQQKFWEMHDRIFAGQPDWSTQATSNPKKYFKQYAGEVGLNVDTWERCFDAGTHLPVIEANRLEGERRMIGQTPTFVIGKRIIPGNLSYDEFKAYVDSAAKDVGTAPGAATSAATASASAAAPAAARP